VWDMGCRDCRDDRDGRRDLSSGNNQTLAALRAAALEDQPSVLRAHPLEETVSAPTPATIRLKRALQTGLPAGCQGTLEKLRS